MLNRIRSIITNSNSKVITEEEKLEIEAKEREVAMQNLLDSLSVTDKTQLEALRALSKKVIFKKIGDKELLLKSGIDAKAIAERERMNKLFSETLDVLSQNGFVNVVNGQCEATYYNINYSMVGMDKFRLSENFTCTIKPFGQKRPIYLNDLKVALMKAGFEIEY